MSPADSALLALRVVLEIGIVAALVYWGVRSGSGTTKLLRSTGAPLLAFGLWSIVDFRSAGRAAEPLRLVEELAISGLAAGALSAVGRPALALALLVLSLGYHALVYALGRRLLNRRPAP